MSIWGRNMLIGPYETNRCYFGDVPDLSRALPDESVHCIVTSPPYWGLRSYLPEGHPDKAKEIGTEKTPEEYVDKLVGILRDLRRALRKDGTLWLNLGDCYYTVPHGPRGENWSDDKHPIRSRGAGTQMNRMPQSGLKHKDLVGIPWSVAFALRADGWWLRMDNVWEKPNPMPESVTDRTTRAHEYMFHLSKSDRYYYDNEAVKEASKYPDDNRKARQKQQDYDNQMGECGQIRAVINPLNAKTYPTRNRRSVWTVPTAPYPDVHFATFPPDLIKPCVMAGTSERGCCPQCGMPWVRKIENLKIPEELRNRGAETKMEFHTRQLGGGQKTQEWRDANPPKTIGWQASCECGAEDPIPAVILDPFLGSGTTGQVCQDLGRAWLGFDLNDEYAPLIEKRTRQQGLF